jgi:hypothetical protein
VPVRRTVVETRATVRPSRRTTTVSRSPGAGTGSFVVATTSVAVSPGDHRGSAAGLNGPVGPETNPRAEKNGTGGCRSTGVPST